MCEAVIELTGVSKKYNLYKNKSDRLKEVLDPRRKKYHRDFYALKAINLRINKGEIVGIVGKNGSGKSTLLKTISGILSPTSGFVNVKEKLVALLELGSGMNPEFTGIENIFFYGAILGYDKDKMNSVFDDIIAFSELEEFICQPLKTYSSGMKTRLAFAVSVFVEPEILVLDEVLAVGDELFRRKCYGKMEEFFKGGKTILYVSHNTESINQLCTRGILLNNGELILEGTTKMVTTYYQKMLYAKSDKKDEVLLEIKRLQKDRKKKKNFIIDNKGNNYQIKNKVFDMVSNKENLNADEQKDFYLPELKPKSTVEFRNYDIDIYDIKILNLDKEQVNCLSFNKRYIYKLKIRCNEEKLANFSVGMEIKTEKGQKISSIESMELYKNDFFVNEMHKNEVIEISYYFRCLLIDGNYYVNHGVSSFENSEQRILSRLVDAYCFKVSKNGKHFSKGFIPLISKIEIIRDKYIYTLNTAVDDNFI